MIFLSLIWLFISFIILPITSFKFNKVSVIRCWSQPYVSTEIILVFLGGGRAGGVVLVPLGKYNLSKLVLFSGTFFLSPREYIIHTPPVPNPHQCFSWIMVNKSNQNKCRMRKKCCIWYKICQNIIKSKTHEEDSNFLKFIHQICSLTKNSFRRTLMNWTCHKNLEGWIAESSCTSKCNS